MIRRTSWDFLSSFLMSALLMLPAHAQQPGQSTSTSNSSSTRHVRKPATGAGFQLDAGSVSNSVYRNAGIGFSCKIPAGWVLRTEEMNTQEGDEQQVPTNQNRAALDRTAEGGCPHTNGCGRVLLAAFARPPLAHGEDVNSSILIAAESMEAYPGLKEAAQYFGPVTEIATAQGLEVINEPYEFSVGTKAMVRGDFQKDVGTRVMLQSTLVLLVHGYVVSFTFIGGTEDEIDELIEGLSFGAPAKSHPPQ
jgi:hypothetical protein